MRRYMFKKRIYRHHTIDLSQHGVFRPTKCGPNRCRLMAGVGLMAAARLILSWRGDWKRASVCFEPLSLRKAQRVLGVCQPSVDSVYLDLVRGKLEMVWSGNSHSLHGLLRSQLIPRGSGRLGLPYAGTNRHPASFIPKAIQMYNCNVGR